MQFKRIDCHLPTIYSNRIPAVICNWNNEPSVPRIFGSASSATYIGMATQYAPITKPAKNRAKYSPYAQPLE